MLQQKYWSILWVSNTENAQDARDTNLCFLHFFFAKWLQHVLTLTLRRKHFLPIKVCVERPEVTCINPNLNLPGRLQVALVEPHSHVRRNRSTRRLTFLVLANIGFSLTTLSWRQLPPSPRCPFRDFAASQIMFSLRPSISNQQNWRPPGVNRYFLQSVILAPRSARARSPQYGQKDLLEIHF